MQTTTKQAHTPGPWAINRGRIVQVTEDGDEGRVIVTPPKPQCVADEANARLMAAAPELLEALKAAQFHLEYCGYGDAWERECAGDLPSQIEAAITKATTP